MNNEKLIAIELSLDKKILLTAIVLAFSLACHKSNVNEQELRNFNQVTILGSDGHPVAGPGKGFVSVFNTDGSRQAVFYSRT